jgi:hypothetical protein
MTAVSQRIPNFLGGVSQQSDEKMFPGQVKDALNCYPDTTLGMIKRPGGKFLGRLASLTANTANSAAWFTVFRDDQEKYIATVSAAGIVRVWDLLTGTEKTVTTPNNSAAIATYLTAVDYRSIKTLTINDFTYILNTEKTVTATAAPTWNAKRQATIVISSVEYDTKYKVTINGTTYTYTSRTNYVTGSPPPQVLPLELSEITAGINGVLPSTVSGQTLTKTVIDNTIYLSCPVDITVSTAAGPDGKYLRTFQDSIDSITKLPEQGKHGYTLKVANTAADKDDYYLKFVAEDGVSGKGYWEETVAPNVSPGYDATSMPVALIKQTNGTFIATFLNGTQNDLTTGIPIKWDGREVGDDTSNTHPSFVGYKIQDIFLFNNRLGFLSEDNIIMSQAGDYYNFYHRTATTQISSDPIDLSVASIRPAIVNSVVPIAQGLLLFSISQQFLMEAEQGTWTPSTTSIRTIANYECDKYLKPVDLGATVMYTSRNQSWTRTFEIFTRGQREAPTVSESSKVVPEWIPQSITQTLGSSQNGLWISCDRSSKYIYLFRYYEQNEERVMTAWARWLMPSNVIHMGIANDILYVLTSGTEGYTVLQHKLVLSPTTGGLLNSLGNQVDPYLDAWFEITTTPTYGAGSTKVYLPTHFNTAYTLRYVVGKVKVGSTTYSGYTNNVTLQSDGGGSYFLIPGDVTGNYIYVGYEYNMELTLPKYYYSLGEQGVDFTGYTNTARMKFYTGLGGDIYFYLKDRTRADWTETSGAQIADYYTADTAPFRDSFVYNVPIHQRPDNYTMKVTSNTPFPVSLVSMQWEGQYTAGFYRRA